ncbi:aldehyde dehydrogenase family protein [Myxococcus sp. AM009]|uniref:aldehyde dehydrogenase family protein n=1 Tax=unclassified Myxococcus TaxID=2648731 RepID=UPI001595C600|nr:MULTISPECIES: aldehyde dehydrogenase family protein [unclassified Myxococcus]NVI98061.1 aldehyde dehydrogenase family protein [Myxococcus sp. AM009]NVJ13672.1 aldehyde dehydrogenase family protein [Myxococcus sp. AM010]
MSQRPHLVDNPFTGDVAASVEPTSPAELDSVLERARAASRALRAMSVAERVKRVLRACEVMEKNTEAIARDITRQMGKPLSQARGEVGGMAGRLRHMAAIAEDSLADLVLPPKDGFERRVAKEPLGVVLDLPAWNYPLLTAVNAIAPAVLAGNAVIVKHSPRTPLCGGHFARAFAEAGAPDGAVQAIFLDYPGTEQLVGDARVDHVLFTGSVLGGHKLQAAARERFLHIGLELGGNDPAYVAPDCDFDKAVENIVDGAMYNAGQSCCAVERVYVHRSLYERFVAAAEPLVRAYVLGDPESERTTMGPIAQPWHPAELQAFVQDATSLGARLVTGGRATQVGGRGRFFEPTLLRDVSPQARLMREESFGPLLPIAPVDSDEEALALMNASRLGLTASVWTSDRERADRLARQLEAGTVYMNRCDALDPALPWSGVKDSGRGVTLSALGFDALTRPKALHYRLRF